MNGERGAKGGRNDRLRSLKVKLSFLKKLKSKNNIKKKFKNISIINFNYFYRNILVEGYKKVKVDHIKRDEHFVFDGIIMITSLLTLLVPEKTKAEKKLERVEEAKIVEKYSEKLKELRLELREESLEEKLLEDDEEKDKDTDTDVLIDNLNILIDRVDNLEEKIKEEDNDKYDSDYLYVIVDDYLKDFSENKEVDEITSSPMYIELSNKIEEVKDKKEIINTKLTEKKENLNIDDKDIKKLKDKYYKYDNYNKDIEKFASKTEEVLSDTKEKLDIEKDKNKSDIFKLSKADKVSKLLLILAAGELLVPMNKDAKKLIVGTTITIFLIRSLLLKDNYKLKKDIKEPIVDYSNKISSDISSIDDKINSINKSINDIDNLILSIKAKYSNEKESKEYKELLMRLEKVKSSLKEKLFVLYKQKNKEEEYLIRNNNRVKKYN